MSLAEQTDRDATPPLLARSMLPHDEAGQPSSRDSGVRDGAMGVALRSVYQQTVEERVPDDLLDLLGKLD